VDTIFSVPAVMGQARCAKLLIYMLNSGEYVVMGVVCGGGGGGGHEGVVCWIVKWLDSKMTNFCFI
jgi:hypothetical protein